MGIFGAAAQTVGSIVGQHMANKANQRLQQNQLDWNENMWHMQNAYNTPEAQMNRMRDADLHPMLALEGMSGGNSGAPAQGVQPAQMENVMEGFDPIGNYLRLENAAADIENRKADTELKTKESMNKAAEIILKGLEGQEKEIFLKDYARRISNETQMSDLQIKSTKLDLIQKNINIDLSNQESILKSIQAQRENIQLMYQEIQTIINTSKSYSELQGTNLANAISKEEYEYMKKYKRKMATDNPYVGLISNLISPEGTQVTKAQVKKGVNWVMQGFRQGIVRSAAHNTTAGKISGFLEGLGIPDDDDVKSFFKR